MRKKGGLYFAIFFLLLGLFGIIQSLTFQYWESVFLPLALSSIIFVMAAVEISSHLRSKQKAQITTEEKTQAETKARVEMHRSGEALGWIVGFSLTAYLVGFIIAVPLFAFSYLKRRGRGWLIATVFAIVILAVVYGVFEVGFKVPLYRGLLFLRF